MHPNAAVQRRHRGVILDFFFIAPHSLPQSMAGCKMWLWPLCHSWKYRVAALKRQEFSFSIKTLTEVPMELFRPPRVFIPNTSNGGSDHIFPTGWWALPPPKQTWSEQTAPHTLHPSLSTSFSSSSASTPGWAREEHIRDSESVQW